MSVSDMYSVDPTTPVYSDYTSAPTPDYTTAGEPPANWRDTCTPALCGFQYAYFQYVPTKSANMAFAVMFGISALAFLGQGIMGKRWLGFTIAMVSGCVLEVIGYAGRVMAADQLYYEVSLTDYKDSECVW